MSEQIQQAIQTLTRVVGEKPAAAKVVFRASTISTADAFTTDTVPAGFERVTFATRVTSSEPEEKIAALARAVEQHCPVLDILRRPIEVSGAFLHVTPDAARDAA